MRVRHWLLPALAFALLIAPLGAQGGLPPVGPLLWGPTLLDPSGDNNLPDAAMRPGGSSVVVWSDYAPAPVITSDGAPISTAATTQTVGLLYQLLDGRGEPQGQIEEVGVTATLLYAVASDAAGNFVVAWESNGGVFSRRFNADGTRRDPAPVTIDTGANLSISPAVASDRAGNFVVTWADRRATDTTDILARRFPAAGAPPGDLITVTTVLSSTVDSLAVDNGEGGAFVVAWSENRYSDNSVLAAPFGPGASAPATTTVVASGNDPYGGFPTVDTAMAPDGRFVVAWYASQGNTILAQPYTADGNTRDTRAIVSDGSYVGGPAVAMDAAGNFTVAYSDPNNYRVVARRYTAAGAPADPPLEVGTGAGGATEPAIAVADDGEFVVAWRDSGNIWSQLFRRPAVEATQTFSETSVREGGFDDRFAFELRTEPTGTVTVTLTPESPQISLALFDSSDLQVAQAAPGVPLRYVFAGEGIYATVPVSVTAVNDLDAEGTQVVRVRVTAEGPGTGYDATPLLLTVDGHPTEVLTVTVYDNDSARYAIGTSTAGTSEGSTQPVIFTISRSTGIGGRSAVGYSFVGTATFGEDYTVTGPDGALAATGVLTFTAREAAKELRVAIVDDPVGEPMTTIGLQLTGAVPEDAGSISFPVALVTLGDIDLAEVRITQSGGSTVVRRGDPPDQLFVALRTVPTHPVEVTLTPTNRQLNLGMGYGAPLRLTFQPDESAKTPQRVQIFTVAAEEGAVLTANAGISLAARSADPGYDKGARFTVDGHDLGTIPVDLVTRPGENPNPILPSLFLPAVVR